MRKNKKKNIKQAVEKRKNTLDDYMTSFVEHCECCGAKLEVIKHRPKSHTKREVVAATCQNTDHKGGKCPMWCVEIRFCTAKLM